VEYFNWCNHVVARVIDLQSEHWHVSTTLRFLNHLEELALQILDQAFLVFVWQMAAVAHEHHFSED
jgi:hypothetical protein